MSNRARLAQVMPAMLLHEGWWEGWYRHLDKDARPIDAHRVTTHCEFPDSGDYCYIQHNWLRWEDGRTASYDFGGVLDGDRIVWKTDRFAGYGWQTHENTIMLRLDRRDVPDAHYLETIVLAPDTATRARIWQWFKGGKPWNRTLCDEWRIAPPTGKEPA